MNFSFDISKILPTEITQVDSSLQVCRQIGVDRYGYQEARRMLFQVVDTMGEASTRAQRLPSIITTGSKLENSNHHLYILKEVSGESNNNVIGILKVGTKKLFVYDSCKSQHELDVMCVLDFYVHESKQRMGCGRKMFDFMLARENIQAHHLAIDRPSPKFLSFLKKHYHLHAQIAQVNNFVIFDGFFRNRNDTRKNPSHFSGIHNRPPQSSGVKNEDLNLSATSDQQNHGNYSSFNSPSYYGNRQQSPSYFAARDRMYSRHDATPPNVMTTPPSRGFTPNHNNIDMNLLPTKPILQPISSHSNRYNNGPGDHSLNNPRLTPNQNETSYTRRDYDINHNKINSPSFQGQNMNSSPNDLTTNRIMSNNNSNNINAMDNKSLHQTEQQTKSALISSRPSSRSSSQQSESQNNSKPFSAPVALPSINPGRRVQFQSNMINQRPPSGRRLKPSEPPVLQRDGPPDEYRTMLNMHQTYQGRNGRFIISDTKVANAPVGIKPPQRPSTYEQSYGDWNWSVSGYLREQGMKQNTSTNYQPRRLW